MRDAKRAKREISNRPGLADILRAWREQASAPPFAIADATAVAIVRAFELGQAAGAERSADRVQGVIRSLRDELQRPA